MTIDNKIEELGQYLLEKRLDQIMEKSLYKTDFLAVGLENTFFTQNVSAAIRSSECFGLQNIYQFGEMPAGRVNKLVAKGATNWIDFHERTEDSTEEVLNDIKAKGYRIVATMPPGPGVTSLYDFDVTEQKTMIIMGNEGKGVSDAVKAAADVNLTIPMFGFTESFNISVAVAIILYELRKQLEESDIEWKLSPERLKEIRYKWIKQSLRGGDEVEKEVERRFYHPNDQ